MKFSLWRHTINQLLYRKSCALRDSLHEGQGLEANTALGVFASRPTSPDTPKSWNWNLSPRRVLSLHWSYCSHDLVSLRKLWAITDRSMAHMSLLILPHTMLLSIPPAACTFHRAMGMSSEQSKQLKTCWKMLVILIWPYWHTGPLPFPGVACHLLNCWWGDRYGQTSHSSQKSWLPNGRFWRSLELQMNSLKTNRKQPSTHATKPKSFQIFQTIPMFGSPQVEFTHLGESSQLQILPDRTCWNPRWTNP